MALREREGAVDEGDEGRRDGTHSVRVREQRVGKA